MNSIVTEKSVVGAHAVADEQVIIDTIGEFHPPLNVGVNIGRAVLQRAIDFKSRPDALFEGVANGYEAYDFGQTAKVDINIIQGKSGFVTITDFARGMDRDDLARFFSLHAHTQRRVGGRNLRGYNGTGKVAPLVVGRSMRVDTVRNGFRNVVVLTLDAVEKAAATNTPIVLKELVRNEQTTDANGTTLTISKLMQPFKAEDIREVREKISLEMMMWMKGAEITVNGEAVEAQKIVFDEERIVTSECGNFTAKMMYREIGHPEELAFTFVSCGPIFVARENFGKEGHKYSSKVSVAISTTEDWANEHFNTRRERFVSESRDLKMKTTDAKARELRDFAIKAVSEYMKELVDQEEQRKKDEDNKLLREWEQDLSRAFSSMWDLGGRGNTGPRKPSEEKEVTRTTRNPADRKGKVNIEFKPLADSPEVLYVIVEETRDITINTASHHAKVLPVLEDDPTRRQALTEVVMDAFVELKARTNFGKEYGEIGLFDPMEAMKKFAEFSRTLKADVKTKFGERYRAFAVIRSA